MNLIALDSSGQTATVALVSGGKLLGEYTINHKKTHSQTLMPMLDALCTAAEFDPAAVDAIAVSAGPGSFTGLRIGAAAAKGMAQALDKPVIAVSTLKALAWQFYGSEELVCPMMDARRAQVYSGIYRFQREAEGARLTVVAEGAALPAEEQLARLNAMQEPVIFLGDGVEVHRTLIETRMQRPFILAPLHRRYQSAACVAACAAAMLAAGEEPMPAALFAPEYLRPSQAERERAERGETAG
ncbi:MAG: tRNA (adenosine(37)-N6)-threonylcarbamoyltransferase complex dimerization subunit type 1 TsaB [Lachnospiraceae bacterium]|nr:tRNA (adenosine(37)-N6)-threonylcarbamoyltransferase complex dimerization subunit type 1 TsaB [Lachnospiraceae bacterium]